MPELKLGIIGCGRVVELFHLPALRRSEIWAVQALCDSSQARLATVHGLAPAAALWSDADRMLASEHLDAVLIATPPDLHLRWVSAALRSGLHTLVEKPGGLSLEQSLLMADQVGDRVAWVGFNRRFLPAYVRLRCALAGIPHPVGARAVGRLSVSIQQWSPVTGYLGAPERGGSVELDVLSHLVDLLPWIFGETVERASCNRWEDPAGAPGEIRFCLTLESGIQVDGTAAHGRSYEESLAVTDLKGSWMATPMGLVHASRSWPRWLTMRSAAQAWAAHNWVRFRIKRDPLLESFAGQLQAFGDRILKGHKGSQGLDLVDLPKLYARLEALRLSAQRHESVEVGP